MSEDRCKHCGNEFAPPYASCPTWACHVAEPEANGGRVHAPNGLPICCIKADNTMLEHEHGDHPDYKFPVEVEYVGLILEPHARDYEAACGEKAKTESEVRDFCGETHALLYTDGYVAVTIYEYNYHMWLVRDGSCLRSPCGPAGNWKLAEASLTKIRELAEKARS